MDLSGLGRVGVECRGDFPGQQFLDAIDRMLGDLRQNSSQVEGRMLEAAGKVRIIDL